MPGQVFLVSNYITLLPELPELPVRVPPERVLRVLPERVRQVRQVFQVPERVRAQVPQPSGVQPASALLPFCSQPLQRKTSRRKAGIE